MRESTGALGIFDSGVGGLTVARALFERLPNEPVVYLGDTARVPYGSKSVDTVVKYARMCTAFLLAQDVKLLVVACNTASAYALDMLRKELDIPVIGVIQPGVCRALAASPNRRIGIIGTRGTISSGAYQRGIHQLAPEAEVHCKACPLFVPLAEEGWTEGPVPRMIASSYLDEFKERCVDALVLGCTHYPLLTRTIADVVGPDIALVDSAETTAQAVAETLGSLALDAPEGNVAQHRFVVTDDPEGFSRVGQHFLARDIPNVEWVEL